METHFSITNSRLVYRKTSLKKINHDNVRFNFAKSPLPNAKNEFHNATVVTLHLITVSDKQQIFQ